MKKIIILALCYISYSCNFTSVKSHNEEPEPVNIDSIKQTVLETEKAFNQMAADIGIKEAFLEFAADSAVLVRGPGVIKGKAKIADYFNNQTLQEVKLQWSPKFVDVSKGGDLAYTYGPYTFSVIDSTGKQVSNEGIFHTVWKKQPNGEWKYVYD